MLIKMLTKRYLKGVLERKCLERYIEIVTSLKFFFHTALLKIP
jgi:hypothetical protein